MATINVGGGHGGKKAVDSDIPLIPFIDLLLCCVMFLLVTAVWNQLARIDANQQQPGQTANEPPPEEKIKVVLQVQAAGYVISSTAGDRLEIPKAGDKYDVDQLRERLQERKKLEPNRRDLVVSPDDGVIYADVVEAMDTVVGEGFPDMSLSDGSTL
jgi:biopolymer transport protein ExbD